MDKEAAAENGVREVHHCHHGRGGSFLGSVLLLLGVLFILREAGVLPYFTLPDLMRFWPVLLILFGFALLRRGFWSVLAEILLLAAIMFLIIRFWAPATDMQQFFRYQGMHLR